MKTLTARQEQLTLGQALKDPNEKRWHFPRPIYFEDAVNEIVSQSGACFA